MSPIVAHSVAVRMYTKSKKLTYFRSVCYTSFWVVGP